MATTTTLVIPRTIPATVMAVALLTAALLRTPTTLAGVAAEAAHPWVAGAADLVVEPAVAAAVAVPEDALAAVAVEAVAEAAAGAVVAEAVEEAAAEEAVVEEVKL